MGIFGGGSKQQRLFGVRINQSVYGNPIPVVMGTAQVQQSLLWVDGFTSTKVSAKGGKGGGKSGQYEYRADVVAALCEGPILGIGDVWSGSSWLGNPTASETYTIASPYTYTPLNASVFNLDGGVGMQNTYSGSYNDVGAPSVTTLSGTDLASMIQVPYGTSLTSGHYSINPSGNVYNFSSADAGKTVQLSYSFLLTTINRTQTGLVPASKQISVTGVGTGSKVSADYGVRYTTGPQDGVAFTKVSGTPSATGTYSVSGNNPAVYQFASGDINAEVTITFGVNDPNAVSSGQLKSLNYTLNAGTQGQSPYSFLTASYPTAAFGFTNVATILYQPMDLGFSASVQENRFEVITPDIFGSGVQDCNPIQCIGQVLTNSVWGLGVGPVPFPTQCIDNGASGTWGTATTAGTRSVNSTAWNWFAAQNFFISPVLDGQDTAASTMGKWLEAGCCAAFYSEGLLKLVPYGDTSAAANGYTWTAPSSYVVALDDTCFLSDKQDDDPVKIERSSASDAWNVVQINWDNRFNQYSPEITPESDQALIARWGERREDAQAYDFIHTVTAATFAANLRLKRGIYIRNKYVFNLPFTFSYLEPMDVIPISTTSVWAGGFNNANLGITNLLVRIQKIVDDPQKGLEVTCEDYPWGAHQPTLYNKQLSEAVVPANAYADPGSSEVVMFEATNRLTGYQGNEIWIGAMGTSSTWGSCNVWASEDGSTYQQIGTIKAPARLGTLASTFGDGLSGSPPSYDPDYTDSLVVNLAENCEALEAGTTTDADSGNTLCFCDGEIISYSALAYTGANQVTMSSYIRRGLAGTPISSHSAGGLFLRLDASVLQYKYDPVWAGKTLYFKFQSVNAFGLMSQQLSELTPTAFTIPGQNPGSIDASSGLVLVPNPNLGAGPLGWTPISTTL